jgi:hypothetical protein
MMGWSEWVARNRPVRSPSDVVQDALSPGDVGRALTHRAGRVEALTRSHVAGKMISSREGPFAGATLKKPLGLV